MAEKLDKAIKSRLSYCLNSKYQFFLKAIIFAQIINAVLEIIGLGVFIPIFKLLSNESEFLNNNISTHFFNYLSITTSRSKNLIILIFFLIFYCLKTLYSIINNFLLNKFITNSGAIFGIKLYKSYMGLGYLEFSKNNFSSILKILKDDIAFFTAYLNAIISLWSEIILISVISIGLLIYDFKSTLVLGVTFFTISALYFFSTKSVTGKLAFKRNEIIGRLLRNITDSVNGFKELIVFQLKSKFAQNHILFRFQLAKTQSYINTLNTLPKYIFELILFSLIILILLYYEIFYIDKETLLLKLGLFTLAAFKIIPSINKISTALQSIKINKFSVDLLLNNLKQNDSKVHLINENKIFLNKEIRQIFFENIYFSYNENKNILSNLNLKIGVGKSILISGESGSGKTTLINIISGVLSPKKGKITINNKTYDSIPKSLLRQIAIVSQEVFIFEESISNNISLDFLSVKKINDQKRIDTAIESAGLKLFVDNLANGTNTLIGEKGYNLSGGQRQRISVARALYRRSKILILDESTSSLDGITENILINHLMKIKNNIGLIIVSHKPEKFNFVDEKYTFVNNKLLKSEG